LITEIYFWLLPFHKQTMSPFYQLKLSKQDGKDVFFLMILHSSSFKCT